MNAKLCKLMRKSNLFTGELNKSEMRNQRRFCSRNPDHKKYLKMVLIDNLYK